MPRPCCNLGLHIFAILNEGGVETRAAKLTNVRTPGLVAVDGWVGHASKRGVFQIRKVFEQLGKKERKRVHFDVFGVVVDIGRL